MTNKSTFFYIDAPVVRARKETKETKYKKYTREEACSEEVKTALRFAPGRAFGPEDGKTGSPPPYPKKSLSLG